MSSPRVKTWPRLLKRQTSSARFVTAPEKHAESFPSLDSVK